MCDLPSGKIKISSKIEQPAITEGLVYFQQQNPAYASLVHQSHSNNAPDLTGDQAFMADMLKSIATRAGERVIRAKWRDWVLKFTRIAAAFEESVYGASALYIGSDEHDNYPHTTNSTGHGYVWADDEKKSKELAGNVTRIEGWRSTRSYYSFIQVRSHLFSPLSFLFQFRVEFAFVFFRVLPCHVSLESLNAMGEGGI